MLKFIKDFFIYGFAAMFGKIAAVFLMPVYTSILSQEDYGAMAVLSSLSGIVGLFSNLNIHSGIARDYYEKDVDRKSLISTGFWSILTLSSIVMCCMFAGRDFIRGEMLNLDENFDTAMIFVLLSVPAASIMSYFSILTRYKKKPVLFSLGIIMQLMVQIGISIYTIVVLKIGVSGFFFAMFVSELLAIVYFAFLNKEYIGFGCNRRILKKALLFSLPTLPAIMAGWFDSSFGQILIGRYVSLEDVGVYSIALQIASGFTLISMALNNVWTPFLYENYMKPEFVKQVDKIFILFVVGLSCISLTLSLFSREVILLLSNEAYLDAALYVTLLCIPMGVYLLFPFASSGVSISRDTKYIGIAYVAGSLFNIAFIFICLPILGVVCVPVGLGISRLVSYGILYVVTKRKNLLVLPNRYVLYYVLTVCVCVICINQDLGFVVRVGLFLLGNTLLLVFLSCKINAVAWLRSVIK